MTSHTNLNYYSNIEWIQKSLAQDPPATSGSTYSSPFYWNAPANLNSFKVFKFTIQVYLVNLNKI